MFIGFTPETIDFLWGIRMNNNRDWFLEHKKQYVSTLYEPMKALGKDLFAPFMENSGDDPEGQPHLPGRPTAPSRPLQGKSVALHPAGRGVVGGKSLPVL